MEKVYKSIREEERSAIIWHIRLFIYVYPLEKFGFLMSSFSCILCRRHRRIFHFFRSFFIFIFWSPLTLLRFLQTCMKKKSHMLRRYSYIWHIKLGFCCINALLADIMYYMHYLFIKMWYESNNVRFFISFFIRKMLPRWYCWCQT